jgi:hypothetical protein
LFGKLNNLKIIIMSPKPNTFAEWFDNLSEKEQKEYFEDMQADAAIEEAKEGTLEDYQEYYY